MTVACGGGGQLWVLGPTALAGIALLFCIIPLNLLLSRKMMGLQLQHMPYMDLRNRLCAEMCRGMRGLKLNGCARKMA